MADTGRGRVGGLQAAEGVPCAAAAPHDRHMPPRRTGRLGQPSLSPRRAPRPATRPRARTAWARRRRSVTTRPQRDWIQISVTALPGLAAVIALIFTSLAIRATGAQLRIAEQGQITDRYNAAITNLGSSSVDVRLGGIYALQRIMQDSPRDQPTVVAVLCAFVRDHANTAPGKPPHIPATPRTSSIPSQPSIDVQAALTVVGFRNIAYDGSTTVIDLSRAQLTGANLTGADLNGANLNGADLNDADLNGAHLEADLSGAHLVGAAGHRNGPQRRDCSSDCAPQRRGASSGQRTSMARTSLARTSPARTSPATTSTLRT